MEREVQLMEGRQQAWPLHMMGMAAAASTTTAGCFVDDYSSGGDCFVLGWEQLVAPAPFGCFGLLAADVHDLFPLFAAGMELPAPLPSSSSAHDVAAAGIPGELDDLLLVRHDSPAENFWDASCHDGDVGEPLKAQQQQQEAAFNSSCCVTVTDDEQQQDYCTQTDSFVHCERPSPPPF